MANNKLRSSLALAVLIVCNAQAAEVIDGLYNIRFNEEFSVLAPVTVDADNLYVDAKYIDDKMKSKFVLGEGVVKIPKFLVVSSNNDDMVMSVNLDDKFFLNNTKTTRLNYVERDVSRIDSAQVVSYVNNNYSLNLDNFKNLSGYLQTKYSNKDYWSLQNRLLYLNSKLVRLGTTYKKEYGDKSALQIGDVIEDGVGQLVSVNGLGVKYATNYFNNSTNSNLLESLPQYSVNGFSLTPSIFNLYSNSNSVLKQEVSSGNYNIIMPYNNGYGVYNGYVRDYLGNLQQFNIPYYNSTKLLKEGTFEYSTTAAGIRKNQYDSSFDYSKPFASAVAKYGVTKSWTQDLSAHYSSYFQNVYTGANFHIDPRWGLFQAGVNLNGQNQKLYNVGWEYYSNDPFIFRISKSQSDTGFCIYYLNDCIKQQDRYFAAYKLPYDFGNISYQKLNEQKLLFKYTSDSITWSKSISNSLNLSLMYERVKYTNSKDDHKVLALLTYNFNDMWSSSINAQKSSVLNSYQARIYKAEDRENPQNGYGYATLGSSNNVGDYNVNYAANLQHFSYRVQASNTNKDWGSKLGVTGSVLYIPEERYLSFNKSTEGIMLVDTSTTTPLEIYHQNKLAGLTDSDGRYIITKGSPYTTEKVELNLKTLPVDKNFEQFKYDVVVPEYGAARIKFKPLMGDTIIYVDLPEASVFTIAGESFIVGKNGEASVNREGVATAANCTFTVKIGQTQYRCQ